MSLEDFQCDFDLHRNAKDVAEISLLAVETETLDGGCHQAVLAEAYLDLLKQRGLPGKLICYPSIQLASGAYFDFLDPDSTPVSREDLAHALSKVARCNGHTLGDLPLSVAQHCVLASRVAPVNFKFEALMHDAAEALTGDMTTPLKQLLPDFKQVEKRIERAIRHLWFLPVEMSAEVKTVDIRLACTEKRDVMPGDPPGSRWMLLDGVEPYPVIIEPWPAPVAKSRWLTAFNTLCDEHLVRVRQCARDGVPQAEGLSIEPSMVPIIAAAA